MIVFCTKTTISYIDLPRYSNQRSQSKGASATHSSPNLDCITTFRQHTYADKYCVKRTFYTMASPVTSANAQEYIFMPTLMSLSWIV